MAVDQERGAGQQAGIHAHAFAGVHLDEHESLPLLAITLGFRFQLLQEAFLEFQDFLDVHAGDEWLGGRIEARLLTSEGSSRSSTERCWTARTRSMPSRLKPRLRFKKLEI